ncbi:MAG: PaaX family transcriptional regulator [Solirubrobacteraceae bacterium]
MAGVFPPRALLLSVLGAYMRSLGGWMPVGGLIRLMGELGVEEQAVRSAISRFKRRGLLVAERRERCAGYRLSEAGLRLIEQGDERIYGRPQAARLDDGWALVVFSVPDSKRADRHVLRSQLCWLGYGNLSPAVWLAPWHVESETRQALARLGLAEYVKVFRAHYGAFGTPEQLVEQCWNVEELRARYAEFEQAASPLARRWPQGSVPDGVQALIDHVALLTMWRPLPFLDAGLPVEALPGDWPGLRAWETFHRLIELLQAPAVACAQAIVEGSAETGACPSPLAVAGAEALR